MNRHAAISNTLRIALALVAGCTAACSMLGPMPADEGSRRAEPAASNSPAPTAPASSPAGHAGSGQPSEPPTPPHEPAATREPPPLKPAEPREPAPPSRVIVLASSDTAAYAEIADALQHAVSDDFEIERLTLGSELEPERLASGPPPVAVVAIGMPALERASREIEAPLVFCQIFRTDRALALAPDAHGVAALPPPNLQLEAWKSVASGLDDIGVITSADDETLAPALEDAAAAAGVELHSRRVSSDREALYMFKRLVPEIDGLWLLPYNEILSPGVIRQMLDYGREHGVQTLVFNASLLDWGAQVAVGADPRDVAATLARVLRAVTSEDRDALPPVTPLSEIEMRVNEAAKVVGPVSLAPAPNARRIR